MKKNKKTILAGVAITIAALLFLIRFYAEAPSTQPKREAALALALPWEIRVLPNGSSRVLGITLQKTTLAAVQASFRDSGEMRMFVSPSGRTTVEVFFKSVDLNGIRGKVVLLLEPGRKIIEAMRERGTRMKAISDGGRQVSLHPEDKKQLRYAPVGAITYIPSADLAAPVIRQRFGEPGKRIPEQKMEGVVHWLYPRLGLDITVDDNGKEMFQYVPPREFQRLLEGLQPVEG
uniref:Uncharacterized protein n=1 Tax=Candidatus Kentrum sp. DK TaxID=2126562 RepID=A0A450TIJ5_9GAMM|nr:MAG: hypothetical protein BECKDK2373C_GA0170839_11596 [Candidatus Kentron sp. DK]